MSWSKGRSYVSLEHEASYVGCVAILPDRAAAPPIDRSSERVGSYTDIRWSSIARKHGTVG